MNKKVGFICLSLIFAYHSQSQVDSATAFQKKNLEGYFIFIRDTIPPTDPDVTLPRYPDKCLFFPNINDSIIKDLRQIDPSTKSYTAISGGYSSRIANTINHRQYIRFLTENKLFEKAHKYFPFEFAKIDTELIRGNKYFIILYKGKLKVVGAFYTVLSHYFYPGLIDDNNLSQKLYLWLPVEENKVDYFCTILY